MVTGLALADPLICPDGCTDDAQHSSGASHAGACLSCHHGIVTTEPQDPVGAPIGIASELKELILQSPIALVRDIEHPPRFA
jgi:hypothetical protein